MFQASFSFHIFYRLGALKTLYFNFCKTIKNIYANELKLFLQIILQVIMKTNDTWNIRHLAGEPFVPATPRIILKIDGFLLQSNCWCQSPLAKVNSMLMIDRKELGLA